MNKIFINEYINKLRKEDVYNYSINLGLILDEDELDIIYDYIKNHHKRFFDNSEKVINEIRDKVSNKTYLKIEELYNKYKTKIS